MIDLQTNESEAAKEAMLLMERIRSAMVLVAIIQRRSTDPIAADLADAIEHELTRP